MSSLFSWRHIDITCFVLAAWVMKAWVTAFFRAKKFPPSPKGVPVIGHAPAIPKHKPWETLWRWGQQCGPIFHLSIIGRPLIILHDFKAADDLLIKRSAAFSDRPFRLMAHLCKYDFAMVFLSLGERFNRTKKHMHEVLNERASAAHHELQEREVQRFARYLLKDHSNLPESIHKFSASTLLSFALGYDMEWENDSLMSISETVSKNGTSVLLPGKYWIDYFPFLKFLPLSFFGPTINATVRQFRAELEQLFKKVDSVVHESLKRGSTGDFYGCNLLADVPPGYAEEHRELVHYTAVSLYSGAADNTSSALETFFVSMMLFPEVQRRAQSEIDSVLCQSRLPVQFDQVSMPYVSALAKEVLRWNPVVPLTSRCLMSDQWYGEYLLPKGANVIANIWAMTHDESVYPRPFSLKPERLLDADGKLDEKAVQYLDTLAFGFGRRVCPGNYFADATIWITVCTILAVFTIAPPLGPDGQEMKPEVDCLEGSIFRWKPYRCRLMPRSAEVVDLLMNAER